MQFQTNPRKELHVMVAQKQWDENRVLAETRVTIPACQCRFRSPGGWSQWQRCDTGQRAAPMWMRQRSDELERFRETKRHPRGAP